jgi:predicted transcriptional regulator
MSSIVPVDKQSELIKQLELAEEAGILSIKGYKNSEIAELLDITPRKAKEYIVEYYKIIQQQAEVDPYFLEKIQYNTVKALTELDQISKEAWETVTIATDNAMVTARVHALKLALEVATKKAQLHQLLGTQKADSDYIVRTQKAEVVNQLLSQILKEVVSGCDRCRELARIKLAEAFSLMDTVDAEATEVENHD